MWGRSLFATFEVVFLGVEDAYGMKLWLDFIFGDWAEKKDPNDKLLLSFPYHKHPVSSGYKNCSSHMR